MADEKTTTETTSGSGGSFWDVGLKDLLGAAANVYNTERTQQRVGSGGDQSTTTAAPNQPVPTPVSPPPRLGADLPPWALTLLIVSGAVLAGALAWKALK